MKLGFLLSLLSLVCSAPVASAAKTSPSALELLPADTAMTLILDTTEETWGQLSQFQLFTLIEEYTGTVPNPGGLPYVPFDISYQSSIAPWIGESAVVALMPLPEIPADFENQLLMVAPIADFDAFDGFLEQIAATRSASPTEEIYGGVSIYVWPPEALPAPADEPPEPAPLSWSRDRLIRAIAALPDTAPDFEIEIEPEAPQPPMLPSLAVAVLPGYLVMSAQAAPVRQLIASQRSQAPTLLDASQFQPTLTNPDFEQALVTIYGNVGQINRYAVADPTIFDLPFPPPLPIPLPFPRPDFSSEDIRALTETDAVLESFVKVTDGGILAQGRAYIDPAQPLELGQAPAATNPLPQLLPAPTYLFSSGYDLGGLGLRLLRLLESFNIEQIDTGLAFLNIAVTAATGLDLEADILAWMDGAYGFFLFPSREGLVSEFEPQIELGLGLMLQTSDRPAAELALQALDQFLLSNGVTVESQTINDVAATRWEITLTEGASPTDIVGYGWPSEDVLTLAAGSGSLRRLLNPRPYEPLAEHTTFQNAIAPFPAENQGYSYINMGSTLSFLYRALGLSLETPFVPEAQRFLGTLHSISLTTSQAADYAQADLFFVLAPAED